jgi:hypothetical protein
LSRVCDLPNARTPIICSVSRTEAIPELAASSYYPRNRIFGEDTVWVKV